MAEKKDDFYEKTKKLAEKAENLIEKQVEKLKKSGVIDDVEGYINKTGDFVEGKIDQFKKSDIPDKVDNFVEKTGKNAEKVIKKAQIIGDKISGKVEDMVDNIKFRSKQEENQPSGETTSKPEKI